MRLAIGFFLLAMLLPAQRAFAGWEYFSATVGTEGHLTGIPVWEDSMLGVKFTVTKPVIFNRSGGHIGLTDDIYVHVFAAIIELTGPELLPPGGPNGAPFSHPSDWTQVSEFLSFREFPAHLGSVDYYGDHAPVLLTPGTYGLLFGSGYFGPLYGPSIMPDGTVNPTAQNIGNPEYFMWNGTEWVNGGFDRIRMGVLGFFVVPEPSAFAWAAVVCGLMLVRRRR